MPGTTAGGPGKRTTRQRGGAVLELGLSLPLLLIVLIGSMDFGRIFFYAVEVEDAARAGAVYATETVANTTATAAIAQAAKADAPDIASALTVTSSKVCKCSNGAASNCSPNSCPDSLAPAIWVTVSASYNFQMLAPYPGFPATVTLTRAAAMRAQ